jgi:hypothetical protein
MNTISLSHIPFDELPSQARTMFFIIAVGASARFGAPRPNQSEMNPVLETIWNGNRLSLTALSDPFRMTALLKMELASFSSAGDVQ